MSNEFKDRLDAFSKEFAKECSIKAAAIVKKHLSEVGLSQL